MISIWTETTAATYEYKKMKLMNRDSTIVAGPVVIKCKPR